MEYDEQGDDYATPRVTSKVTSKVTRLRWQPGDDKGNGQRDDQGCDQATSEMSKVPQLVKSSLATRSSTELSSKILGIRFHCAGDVVQVEKKWNDFQDNADFITSTIALWTLLDAPPHFRRRAKCFKLNHGASNFYGGGSIRFYLYVYIPYTIGFVYVQ